MRYLVFSDVHGNLPAFQAVKKKTAKERFDRKICLGDSIGYYPFPNEVMGELKGFADVILPGNHDVVIYEMAHRIRNRTGAKPSLGEMAFRETAWEAAYWTANSLTDESFSMLEGIVKNNLPDRFSTREGNLLFAHSTPSYPEDMDYIENARDAYDHFFMDPELQGLTAFVGHIHMPQFYGERKEDSRSGPGPMVRSPPLGGRIRIIKDTDKDKPVADDVLVLTPNYPVKPESQAAISDSQREREKAQKDLMSKLTVVHDLKSPVEIKLSTAAYARSLAVVPGLGQPRDRLNFTGYVTYDTDTQELCFVRIPYDFSRVAEKTRERGLSLALADRLAKGL